MAPTKASQKLTAYSRAERVIQGIFTWSVFVEVHGTRRAKV
jgi:hypothetical protein